MALASLWLNASTFRGQGADVQQTQCFDASAQEHIRQLIEALPIGMPLRGQLEAGAHGEGVRYDWMDKMRQLGVRRALVRTQFEWHGRPTMVTVAEALYFSKYDNDCAQISDPKRLEEIRDTGLQHDLEQAAIERTQSARWYFSVDGHIRHTKRGACSVELADDEWLPMPPPMLAPLSKREQPLLGAVAWGDEVGVRQQLAEPGVSPKELAAAMQAAAMTGDSCVAKLLLNAGANPNAPGEDGYTPLMEAVRGQQPAIVKTLLQAHVDVNAKDRWGETALSVAERSRYAGIVQLLKQAGARE